MNLPLLAARGLSKSFGPNEVLRDIEFEVHAGAGVALCGENGAGKSTLIKLLTGIYHPTSGHVEYLGEERQWSGPRASLEAGIAVVHQEFSTISALSVAENIFLEAEPRNKLGLIDRKEMNARAEQLLSDLGIDLKPRMLVEDLSVADKQMVEIAKALRSEARVLILDEPTAVLSNNETRHLFRIIADLRKRGLGIVYVSHRLDELFEVCSDITVIKDGSVTANDQISNHTHDTVVSAMVGRELGNMFPQKANSAPDEKPVRLEISELTFMESAPPANLKVSAGEILGIAGLVGSGRTELALAIFGATPSRGSVFLDGELMEGRSPAKSIEQGLLMLTESRKDDGLFASTSVARNFTATTPGRGRHATNIPIGSEQDRAEILRSKFGVVADHVGLPISDLSGGNQQKVLVARLLENNPKVLILDEPTRGVDVGAKAEIYKILQGLADEGMAIMVISSELIEIVGLCDRALVMRDGIIADEIVGDKITEEAIIAVATEAPSEKGVSENE